MAIETVQMNDKEMFSAAMSDEPETEIEAQVEKPVVETPVADGRVRDEQGRFAPKVETPEPVTQQAQPQTATQTPQTEDRSNWVPSGLLREEKESRRVLERELQELRQQQQTLQQQVAAAQPKQEPIDFFTDPSAAFKQQLSPFEAQLQTLQSKLILRASRAEAIAEHGRPAVTEMEQGIEKAMNERHPDMGTLAQQMRQSDDPIGVAMNWFRRDKLLKETGGDLTAYRTKIVEDAMKDPAILARAIEAAKAMASGHSSPQTQPNSVVQLPPSLNRATSAASPHEEQGDMSDRSLWAHARS